MDEGGELPPPPSSLLELVDDGLEDANETEGDVNAELDMVVEGHVVEEDCFECSARGLKYPGLEQVWQRSVNRKALSANPPYVTSLSTATNTLAILLFVFCCHSRRCYDTPIH